jgi:propanol-preferring alcohol dehydrogenase
MRAWIVDRQGPIGTGPLELIEREIPSPGPGQIRVKVKACGVCRTDLHLVEGDLALHREGVTPGHEIVGVVDDLGRGCQRFKLGDRVGIAWLASTCGACRFCRSGRENLCTSPRFTGWDDDGGFADYALVDERYAYYLPGAISDVETAPLLCAGIIGYRALRRANLPRFGRLGIYGFGASAHLAAQIAIREGATVHVLTRSERARELAMSLGAASAREITEGPPEPLDASLLFAPAGDLIPAALGALERGGTLAVAGIHVSDIPPLSYHRHLFEERTLTSVTANTRSDGEELLAAADRLQVRATTTSYPLEQADRALADLAHGRVRGAAVLVVDDGWDTTSS